jgi:hypothetical protein
MPEKASLEVTEVSQLESQLRTVARGIVAIDGCTSAGKTTLMRVLANQLKWPWIDVDEHVNPGRGHFVRALRVSDLSSAIEQASREPSVVLIAGVCMREVLACLECDAALHIYVKRKSRVGIPSDLNTLDLENALTLGDTSQFRGLDREIAYYHFRCRPHRNADVVYVRTVDD